MAAPPPGGKYWIITCDERGNPVHPPQGKWLDSHGDDLNIDVQMKNLDEQLSELLERKEALELSRKKLKEADEPEEVELSFDLIGASHDELKFEAKRRGLDHKHNVSKEALREIIARDQLAGN